MTDHPIRNKHYFKTRQIEAAAVMGGADGERLTKLYEKSPTTEHAEAIMELIALSIWPSESKGPEAMFGADGADMLYAYLAEGYAPGTPLVSNAYDKHFRTVVGQDRWFELKRLFHARGIPIRRSSTPMTNTHPNRTRRIWTTKDGTVCLRDQDEWGNPTIREFWVPPSGGYVREIDATHPGTLGSQVCDRLATRGSTLSATRDTLLDVVRREYRLAVADDRRETAKFA